jgi:hypothetical protein
MGRQQPQITVGGVTLPGSLTDATTIIALGGLTIDWGRDDIYARIEPSRLRLEVLDRVGTWSVDPNRYGESVRVVLPGQSNRVLFRGTVVETRAVLTSISTAAGVEDVWRTTVTAVDVLADLDRDPVRGTIVQAEPAAIAGGANASHINVFAVANELLTQGMNQYVTSVVNPTGLNTGLGTAARATPSDLPSWLEFLYQTWRVVAFAAVGYDPWWHRLQGVVPASAEGVTIALSWSASADLITLVARPSGSGKAPWNLPANRLEVDRIELVSTIQAAITHIEYPHPYVHWQYAEMLGNRWFFPASSWRDGKFVQTVTEGAPIARVASIPLRVVPTPPATPPTLQPGTTIPDLVDVPNGPPLTNIMGPVWARQVGEVNGKIMPPDVTYDFEKWPEDTELEAFLLRTLPDGTPVYMPGSYTSALPNVPVVLEVIGGRHVWEDGWRSTMHFGPTIGAAGGGAGVTISQLVTIPEPGYDDYSPSITLADLGTVTEGVK